MKNYVIIPAYNEENHIAKVINKVKNYTNYVVVVDDGSSDNTSKIAQESGVKVIKHRINLGKGATLKTGCDFAYSQRADNIVVIDADGQHDPKEIPLFLEKLKDNEIVFGYRKQSKEMPFVLKFGNWFINQTLSKSYGIKVRDSQSGFRAFKTAAYKKIRWNSSDYYMETEMIIKSGKRKLKYTQLPIETIYSDNYKGTTIIDGVKIVLKLVSGRLLG